HVPPRPHSPLFPYTTPFRSVLLAQSIVERADIEEQKLACGTCVGSLEQRVRGQIDDHQRYAAFRQRHRRSHGIGASLESDIFQGDRKSTRLNSSHQIISYSV